MRGSGPRILDTSTLRVTLGEEAALWLGLYLRDARPELAKGANDAVFLSARGRRLDTSTLRVTLGTSTSSSSLPSRRRRSA